MKVIFTGGGTGGHFYPIIAVADALNRITAEKKIVKAELIFASDSPFDSGMLFREGIKFKRIFAGKMRRYFSLWNIIDAIKIPFGILKALWVVYFNFPDVIFSKGGYASFPIVIASRIFGIPLMIHESDVIPGKVNAWAGKFAKRIAISFPQAADYFPKKNTALVGNPVRSALTVADKKAGRDFLKLEENIPAIFVIGGSQGSKKINDTIIDILPKLLEKYYVIHQCGSKNLKEAEGRVSVLLGKSPLKPRYKPFAFLNEGLLKTAYSAADLVISRASAGAIFEMSAIGAPSILIPLPHAAQDHQKENAYVYAKTGAAEVIEEPNLAPNILFSEIERLIGNKKGLESMAMAAKNFSKPDAAEKIAKEIINLTLEHA